MRRDDAPNAFHDQALEHFRFRVERFLGWAAAQPNDPAADVDMAARVLSALIYAATKIKDDGCRFFDVDAPAAESQIKLLERFRRLPAECGPVQGVTRFCPARHRDRGLAYCLADIHNELASGMRLYLDDKQAAARTMWRFGYVHSWGKLAICALFVLHSSIEEQQSSHADRAHPQGSTHRIS